MNGWIDEGEGVPESVEYEWSDQSRRSSKSDVAAPKQSALKLLDVTYDGCHDTIR